MVAVEITHSESQLWNAHDSNLFTGYDSNAVACSLHAPQC